MRNHTHPGAKHARKGNRSRPGSARVGKGDRSRLVSDLLLLLCALLLVYPFAAELNGNLHNTQMYAAYTQEAGNLSETDYEAYLSAARAYNETLVNRGWDRFNMTQEEEEEYLSLLSLPGTDVMAYLSIDKLGIESMPIYHSTSQSVLQSGAGHYEGSSLPVGGESTHTVLSSHAGMAGSRLFTDLNRLAIGDAFTISVLGEVLTYQVDQIVTVLPDDLSYLSIEEGEDYCTLITCTPIGLNTHRLLVRGTRIATSTTQAATEGEDDSTKATSWLERLENLFYSFALYEWIMALLALLILFIFLLPDLLRAVKRGKKVPGTGENGDGGKNPPVRGGVAPGRMRGRRGNNRDRGGGSGTNRNKGRSKRGSHHNGRRDDRPRGGNRDKPDKMPRGGKSGKPDNRRGSGNSHGRSKPPAGANSHRRDSRPKGTGSGRPGHRQKGNHGSKDRNRKGGRRTR